MVIGLTRNWGIIPARAGFTLPVRADYCHPGDHPRSRGVYPARRRRCRGAGGSSPLARGLLWDEISLLSILPDHPRSRGVYTHTALSVPSGPGSSPLARGLRTVAPLISRASRIIPARAGFTPPSQRARCARADHPRSRGVYDADIRRAYRGGDHPRSRGVYMCDSWEDLAWHGSSPLARGLRRRESAAADRERIIPARAGFTCSIRRLSGGSPDHPRSRGVYGVRHRPKLTDRGSSPLARGLPEPSG